MSKSGIDPTTVKAIVATHWHDDHIAGIAEVARLCTNANVWLSTALQKDEFREFLEKASFPKISASSGVAELGKLLAVLQSSGGGRLKWAFEGRPLLPLAGSEQCYCLSPSDEDVRLLIRMLNRIIKGDRSITYRPKRNDASIVTYAISAGNCAVFGGDLEHRGHPSRGWKAVSASLKYHGLLKAGFYKVAHHGSITGDRPYIWQDVVAPDPISVIAPWNRGSGLPTAQDVDRIKLKSRETYLAARATGLRYRAESNLEDKILRSANIRIERLPSLNYVEAEGIGGIWDVTAKGGLAHLV